jgi:hypothetical protein
MRKLILLLLLVASAGAALFSLAPNASSAPGAAGHTAGGIEYSLNGNAFSVSDQTGEVVSEPSTRLPYDDLVKPIASTDPVRYEITGVTGGLSGVVDPARSEWFVERRTVEHGKEHAAEQVAHATDASSVQFVPTTAGKYYARVLLKTSSGALASDFWLTHTVRYGAPEMPEWKLAVDDHEEHATSDSEFPKRQYHTVAEVQHSQDMAVRAGFAAIRFELGLDNSNPTIGTFDFHEYDVLVDNLASRGLKFIPLLYATQRWASSGNPNDPN